MHRIHARAFGTRVLDRFGGTAIRAGGLHGRIGNHIAVAFAGVAFESVQEAEPVACFVHGCHAHVVACHIAAGHGGGVDVAAVGEVLGAKRVGCDLRWEGAGSQDAAVEVGVEVEVEVFVGAIAAGFLEVVHGGTVSDGPGVVGVNGDVAEGECDADGIISFVQGGKLGGGHFLSELSGLGGGRDKVQVGCDADSWADGLTLGDGGERVWSAGVTVQESNCLVKVRRGLCSANTAVKVPDGHVRFRIYKC